MKTINWLSLFALSSGLMLAGCDASTSETHNESASREATAKIPGALPFGNRFVWMGNFDWTVAQNNLDGEIAVVWENKFSSNQAGGMLTRMREQKNTTTIPAIFTYLIADAIRSQVTGNGMNATDCDKYTYLKDSVGNYVLDSAGSKIRSPTLCDAGGGWISTHRDSILDLYKRYAIRTKTAADLTTKQPFVYLLEGDYFQYSSLKQDVYLSPTYIGTLIGEIADTIKKYHPNSRVGFNVAGWYDPDFMAEFFRAVQPSSQKANMDFVWITTGFNSDTLSNNRYKSAISTLTWVRRFTGLPVFLNVSPDSTVTEAKLDARIASGAIGGWLPGAPTASQLSTIKLARTKTLATHFPDLAPEGLVTGATRVPNTNSVLLSFRAWDRDAKIGPTTPSQLRRIEVLLNGVRYLDMNGGTTSTNPLFTARISNPPIDMAKKLTVRITDHDGLVTTLPTVSADSITVDPTIYSFNFVTERDAAGKWLPTNAVRFKIPDRSPVNQRVRFVMYDSVTNKQVASIYSDENDSAGNNLWASTGTYADAIQIPTTIPAGTYKFVMMYNDDNLRTNFKNAFTLRSGYLRFDPNIVYDPWNIPYCRTGFAKNATSGYCVAK